MRAIAIVKPAVVVILQDRSLRLDGLGILDVHASDSLDDADLDN